MKAKRLSLYKCGDGCNAELDYNDEGEYVSYSDYADLESQIKQEREEYKYCPYCGDRLIHTIQADETSPKICMHKRCPSQSKNDEKT